MSTSIGTSNRKMPHAAELFHGGLCGQPCPIEGAFAGVGVHREVSEPEGSEVIGSQALDLKALIRALRIRHPQSDRLAHVLPFRECG
jgi:hypothetical protein